MAASGSRVDRRRVLAGFGVLTIHRFLPACSSSNAARGPGAGGAGTGSGVDAAGASAEATCILTPAQTEGPFFIDTGLMRSDIRDGKAGAPLELAFRVVDGDACSPIAGALVEVWHADAAGAYSAFDISQGNGANTAGQTFLRGVQRTQADGSVEFLTVYPGWYPGRTPHVHVMVLLESRAELLTTQLYFPEAVTDAVYATAPYAVRGPRSTTNATDGIGAPAALIGEVSEASGGYGATFRMVVPRSA